jgi:hypothetical protein
MVGGHTTNAFYRLKLVVSNLDSSIDSFFTTTIGYTMIGIIMAKSMRKRTLCRSAPQNGHIWGLL